MTNKTKFPKGWDVKKLGEVLIDIQYGTSQQNTENGKFFVIGMSNIQNGKIITLKPKKCDLKESEKRNLILKEGDILLNRTNSIQLVGKVGIINKYLENTTFASYLVRLILKSETINAYYLNYVLNDSFIQKRIRNLATKAVCQANINPTQLKNNLKIPVPPIGEQERIAEVLSCSDELIEKNQSLLEQKCLLKQALMQKLLSPKKSWKKVKLGDVLNVNAKIAVKDTSKYNKISIKLHKKGVQFFESERIMADTRPFYIRNAGEIIIGKQNYFNGSIAILSQEFDGAICSNAIMSFSTKKTANSIFVYEYISQPSYLKEREKLSNGTGQKELYEKEFLKFDISMPNLEEQIKIANIVKLADDEIFAIEKYIEELKSLKKALMQNLLTGKIRVKV